MFERRKLYIYFKYLSIRQEGAYPKGMGCSNKLGRLPASLTSLEKFSRSNTLAYFAELSIMPKMFYNQGHLCSKEFEMLNKYFLTYFLQLGLSVVLFPLQNDSPTGSSQFTVSTFGRLANFLSENTPNVHVGFINQKYISKYIKMSKIGSILCHRIHC